ncbi:MAG: hypothetical protein JWP36_658 [Paucimonas sp.]|nr:hypothetical protein [Paucimonas sp.]
MRKQSSITVTALSRRRAATGPAGRARLAGCLIAALLLLPGLASAQLYKWTGPDGRVTYSDTPPPREARSVETRARADEAGAAAALPYALRQAVSSHPVVLYTTANCSGCDEGRQLLAARGVPVTEKTVSSNEDIAALVALAGSNKLPVLAVGRQMQQGFEPDGWNKALSAAGYPEQSRLPSGWRNAGAAPLVPPKPKPAQQAASKPEPAAPAAVQQPDSQPSSGIRF